jgi:hypothetical protein
MKFSHWNAWYGEPGKSSFRLITDSNVASTSNDLMAELHQLKQGLSNWCNRVMSDRRRQNLIDQISLDQYKFNDAREVEGQVLPDELERMKINSEDQKLYPSQYRIWRYEIGEKHTSEDQKPRAETWTPYHRLTAREKKIVETKLGPKINRILWTRWPGSTIDSFTPNEDPVV